MRTVIAEDKRRYEHQLAAVLTILVGLLFMLYSSLPEGFYQHDEVGHFLGILDFWSKPNSALGNWAKPGYKVLMAVPGLLGPTGILAAQSAIAALCCYLAYRLADGLGCRFPLLAFALLATQPLWIELSFRTYSETTAALFLIAAALAHTRERYALASAALSFTMIIRQELVLVAIVYAVYLLRNRHLAATVMLLAFPALLNLWGWVASGDLLHLITSTVQKSGETSMYVRQGFEHYLVMSPVFWGPVCVLLLVAYFGQSLMTHSRIHWVLAVPVLVFVTVHCFFNARFTSLGPSTGGNLRYMLTIAPLVATMGAFAIDRLQESRPRLIALVYLVPVLVLGWLLAGYEHNYLLYSAERNLAAPLFLTLVAAVVIVLPRRAAAISTAVVSIVAAAVLVRPIDISEEDAVMKSVAATSRQQRWDTRPILVDNPLYRYYYVRAGWDFSQPLRPITEETIQQSRAGTIVVWDAHYSNRTALVSDRPAVHYLMNPENGFATGEPIGRDGGFIVVPFEKLDL